MLPDRAAPEPAGKAEVRPVAANGKASHDGPPPAAAVDVHRPVRWWPEPLLTAEIVLAAPPAEPEPDASGWLVALLPVLGSVGFVGFAVVSGSALLLVLGLLTTVATVGGTVGLRVAQRRSRRSRLATGRSAYLRHLQARQEDVEAVAEQQRQVAHRMQPDAAGLLRLVTRGTALWERRRGDDDFLRVRLGLGRVPLAVSVRCEQGGTAAGEAPGELSTAAAALAASFAQLDDMPVGLDLARLGSAVVVGDRAQARDLVQAGLAGLAATHAPDDLRLLALVPDLAQGLYGWCRLLPHAQVPGAAGPPGCGITSDVGLFTALLREAVRERTAPDPAVPSSGLADDPTSGAVPAGHAHLLVLVDGYRTGPGGTSVPELDLALTGRGVPGVSVVVLVDAGVQGPPDAGAVLTRDPDGALWVVGSGPRGTRRTVARPDRLDPAAAVALARFLAPLRLGGSAARVRPQRPVGLLGLLGLGGPEEVVPAEVAPDGHSHLLQVPVGVNVDGEAVVLDLTEAADGGMGPHGLVVGATGSGKSEVLRSLVTALAVTHPPELVSFVLVDYKGGAAFAQLAGLPHVSGLVTNLADDPALVDRVALALTGEVERRQRLLRSAGADSLRDLRRRAPTTGSDAPPPSLIVVVDEFTELLVARPELLELFASIGRVGRSLGIHLLLATQRLDEGRLRGLEGQLRYRVCLRTFSAQESQVVLGSTAAFALPPLPGLGYLAVDGRLQRFRSAPVDPPEGLTHGRPGGAADRACPEARDDAGSGPVLAAVVARLGAGEPAPTHRVWLPPLPAAVSLDAALAVGDDDNRQRGPAAGNGLTVVVGLLDQPLEQRQPAFAVDLRGGRGNVAVVGAPRSGKSMLLATLVASLCWQYGPDRVQAYVLDLGGGSLRELERLPHVGAVCGPGDPDRLAWVVRRLEALVEDRARSPDVAGPDVFLVVDGWSRLRCEFPDLEQPVTELAARGLQHGVHVVLATGRWVDLRPALKESVGTRLELRLNDRLESEAPRGAPAVPPDRPGRGLTAAGEPFLVALPRLDGRCVATGLGAGTAELVERTRKRHAGLPPADRPRLLPVRVRLDELRPMAGSSRPDAHEPAVLLGLEETHLAAAELGLGAGCGHLLVLGDPGSGRTTLLRSMLRQLTARYDPHELRLSVLDPRRRLLPDAHRAVAHLAGYAAGREAATSVAAEVRSALAERLPSASASVADLLHGPSWSGPRHVLLVDDDDLLSQGGSPLLPLLELLALGPDLGFHLVLTRRVTGTGRSAFEPFLQRLRELGPAALLLSGDPGEGPLMGPHRAEPGPPGRGLLLRPGERAVHVQLADVPEHP